MPIPIQYILGKWATQKTIYNLFLNKAINVKSSICIRQDVNKIKGNTLYLEDESRHQLVLFNLRTRKAPNDVNHILIFNTYNENCVKKYYCTMLNKKLIIKSKYSKISSIEKFWFVSQNLVLRTSIIQYETKIIYIIFESKIRI